MNQIFQILGTPSPAEWPVNSSIGTLDILYSYWLARSAVKGVAGGGGSQGPRPSILTIFNHTWVGGGDFRNLVSFLNFYCFSGLLQTLFWYYEKY